MNDLKNICMASTNIFHSRHNTMYLTHMPRDNGPSIEPSVTPLPVTVMPN